MKLVKVFELGAQEKRIGYLFSFQECKYIAVLSFSTNAFGLKSLCCTPLKAIVAKL